MFSDAVAVLYVLIQTQSHLIDTTREQPSLGFSTRLTGNSKGIKGPSLAKSEQARPTRLESNADCRLSWPDFVYILGRAWGFIHLFFLVFFADSMASSLNAQKLWCSQGICFNRCIFCDRDQTILYQTLDLVLIFDLFKEAIKDFVQDFFEY